MWYQKMTARVLALAVSLTLLAGCLNEDKDEDSSTSFGTVQFYNASSNSSATRFLVDAELQSVASYGDASSRVSLEADTYEISIERTNTDDASDYVELVSQEVTVSNGTNRLFVMSGDFSSPTLNEYSFTPEDDLETTEITLMGFNLTEAFPQLEIYYGASDSDQASATLLASLGAAQQSDAVMLEADDYVFYVVNVDTGETLLSTKSVAFNGGYNYFVIVREDVINGGISLDQMSSSTFVYNYPNPEANAQVRAYNSIDELDGVDLTLVGSSNTQSIAALGADSQSAFLTLPYGDYVMSLADPGTTYLQNKLISLQAGAAKNILLYRNSSNAVVAMVYDQDMRERVYEHDINLISLADIRDAEDERFPLRAYFVNEEKGETKETASQVISGIEFASVENFSLVSGNYAVYLMYTDDDNQEMLVAEKALLELQPSTNYQLVLEADATAFNGYRLSVLE